MKLDLRRGFRRLAWTPILLALALGVALRLARANGAITSDWVYWLLAAALVLAALAGWLVLRLVGFVVVRAAPERLRAGAAVAKIDALSSGNLLVRLVLSFSGPIQALLAVGRMLASIESGDFPRDMTAFGRMVGIAAGLLLALGGFAVTWSSLTFATALWVALAALALAALVAGLVEWAARGFRPAPPKGAVDRAG